MTIRKVFFTLLTLSFVLPASAAAQRLNPKVKKDHAVRRLVLLPAKVQLVKVGIKGREPMEKETAAATPVIEKVVAQVLQEKKFIVSEDTFRPEKIQDDENLKYAVADLQTKFDQLEAKIAKKSKDIEQGRFTLGDQVLLVNQDDTADAFVFIRAFGQQSTKGKKAFALLTLNPVMTLLSFPMCFVTITVVDARTGEVLAQSQAITAGDVIKETDKALTKPVTSSLKKLPSPSEKTER